jgi:hypothetical protein
MHSAHPLKESFGVRHILEPSQSPHSVFSMILSSALHLNFTSVTEEQAAHVVHCLAFLKLLPSSHK